MSPLEAYRKLGGADGTKDRPWTEDLGWLHTVHGVAESQTWLSDRIWKGRADKGPSGQVLHKAARGGRNVQVLLESLGVFALWSRSGQHGELCQAFSKIGFYEALAP